MKTDNPSMLFAADGHPDENLLFLAIEHELSPEEAQQVEKHLGACWSCRTRSEEMQKGISAFMEYREERYAPMRPAPPNNYRNFARQLRELSRESEARETVVDRLKTLWNRLRHFLFPSQIKWMSLVAGSMAMVLLYLQILSPPPLSADQFLARAEAAQVFNVGAEQGDSRIVRQTVQIVIDGHTTVRTFVWTSGQNNPAVRWDREQMGNAPLTAAGFAGWRQSLDEKTDKTKRSGDFWLLETTAPHDFIREARLTVRATDFHPVEQRVRFRDERELVVKELGFDVQEQSLPTRDQVSKPAPQTTVQNKPPATAPGLRQAAASLPAANMDETEMQLRYQLFTNQWDLGEDLTIARSNGDVVLSGTISSPEREATLRAALTAIPHVRVETNAPVKSAPAGARPNGANPQPTAAPLLEGVLSRTFSTKDDQSTFVEESLAASDTLISHAWALKRLADRYGDSQIRDLSPESRRKLAEMIQAHLRQLNQSNAVLDQLLSLLPPAAGQAPATTARGWQGDILSLFTQIQRQDHAITDLLAGTPQKSQSLPAATADFESGHQTINALLRSLNNINLGPQR